MKKALLFNILFLLVTLSVFAYETIIIRFPDKELWERAFYKKTNGEALLQYVIHGDSADHWKRAIFIHSYNYATAPVRTFMSNNIRMMQKMNPTSQYKILKMTGEDAIAGRCTKQYGTIEAQCEFFRVTMAHGVIISLHYVNKDRNEFMNHYSEWYNIIKTTKFYNSYWRDDRILDKAIYFEL